MITVEERSEETVVKTVVITVGETIRLLKNNPNLTVEKLSEHIGLAKRGVEYPIAKLKKQGKLKRIGPNK